MEKNLSLKNVKPGDVNSFLAELKKLNRSKVQAANSDTPSSFLNDDDFSILVLTIENLKETILVYENFLDRDVDNTLKSIDSMIVDQNSLYRAVQEFDLDWFCHLPVSVAAKSKIADALIKAAKKVNPQFHQNLWDSISKSDNIFDVSFIGV